MITQNGQVRTPGTPEDEPNPITAAQLAAIDFADPEMVIDDVLPVGVHLLVGKPKKGKSWMALGMCEAVSTGGKAFGVKGVREGTSLYLALEDNPRRLLKRLRKVLDGRDVPERMYIETRWRRLDEGGAEHLAHWLRHHPDTRLVVIDTLAKIRKPARGVNVYAEDYAALEQLLPIAQEHNIAIVVVYHLRKAAAADPMDEISSSTGLTAGVDGFLILRRTPGSKGPTLYVDGRDIEEPTEYALHWNINTATWTIEGDAEQVHLSKERADILLVLNRAGQPMTPKEVTEALDPHAKYNNVKYLMWTMLGDGQLLKNERGAYYPANPTNPTNLTNSTNPANPAPKAVSGLVEGPKATNRVFTDTYAENGASVGRVSKVSGDSGSRDRLHPTTSFSGERDSQQKSRSEGKGVVVELQPDNASSSLANSAPGGATAGMTFAESAHAERCIHGFVGGKGCYLHDAEHPYRSRDGNGGAAS
jgi:AAA domain